MSPRKLTSQAREEASPFGPLPSGFPPWLGEYVERAEKENRTLAENGAEQAVQAREALLRGLVAAAQKYLDQEVTVVEAARASHKHPETIRRAVRKGTLPDGRINPRGRVRIRRGDLELLAGASRKRYDPLADAQDIAQRRRPR